MPAARHCNSTNFSLKLGKPEQLKFFFFKKQFVLLAHRPPFCSRALNGLHKRACFSRRAFRCPRSCASRSSTNLWLWTSRRSAAPVYRRPSCAHRRARVSLVSTCVPLLAARCAHQVVSQGNGFLNFGAMGNSVVGVVRSSSHGVCTSYFSRVDVGHQRRWRCTVAADRIAPDVCLVHRAAIHRIQRHHVFYCQR